MSAGYITIQDLMDFKFITDPEISSALWESPRMCVNLLLGTEKTVPRVGLPMENGLPSPGLQRAAPKFG